MNRLAHFFVFFYAIFFFVQASSSFPAEIFIKQLSIKSLEQQVLGKERFCFRGEVEVKIDDKLHVWADVVDVDQREKTLVASSEQGGSVKIENNKFLILADRFQVNFQDKTGFAEKVKFHFEEGFLCADRAERRGEDDWCVTNMLYTPCDSDNPHWCLSAKSARVHARCFIKAYNIVFKIGGVPCFYLPQMVFPIQGNSKSGFLMPRFYFDYVYGFGLNLRYYKYFGPHCDTTLSADWRDKRGLVLSDEFRWAIAPENFLNIRGNYAIARDSFVQKKNKIFKATDHRYWIQGTAFRSSLSIIPDAFLASLIRLDFGTDKKIGYHFFNTTDDVDDEFYNSGHLRLLWPQHLFELSCAREKTDRKQFFIEKNNASSVSNTLQQASATSVKPSVREEDVHVVLSYLPRIEWNSGYYRWGNLFSFRQDFFIDQVTAWQLDRERFFVNGLLQQETDLSEKMKADLLRVQYRSNLRLASFFYGNGLSCWINPSIQFRSNLRNDVRTSKNVFERQVLGRGVFRFFVELGGEWAMPEFSWSNNSGNAMAFLRPIFRWELTPQFDQDHWHYCDRWDRAYPKNQISALLRKNVVFGDFSLDCDLIQRYDFYDQSKIFFLNRGTVKHEHFLPLRLESSLCWRGFSCSFFQEFEWCSQRLLQSEVMVGFQHDSFLVNGGYLFQKKEIQQARELVANIPHFFTLSAAINLTKKTILSYSGQLYAEGNSKLFSLSSVRPLLHRVRLEYSGHCWGFYLGFEEKNYRDSGNWRRDRAMVLGIRLDSLGSFAQKFRPPQNVQMAYDQY